MNKTQHRTIGAIVKIDMGDGFFSFARILEHSNFAFYDFRTQDQCPNLNAVALKPILFIVAVYNDAVTKGRWQKIGKLPIEASLKQLPLKFMQDLYTGEFELYNPNTGEITPATRKECEGLERASVWAAEHVESRLKDHYNMTPNVWVEKLKMK